MKNPNDWGFAEAAQVYGIANTPLFLLRKLQADAEVRAIGEECSGELILDALRAAIAIDPETPIEAVRPYALLVALWFKPTLEHLREAARFSPKDGPWRWFDYLAAALIETFSPVESQIIRVPASIGAPAPRIQSATPASRIIVVA